MYIHLQDLQERKDISQLQSNQVCLMCAGKRRFEHSPHHRSHKIINKLLHQ